jgi:hypothetical protein
LPKEELSTFVDILVENGFVSYINIHIHIIYIYILN